MRKTISFGNDFVQIETVTDSGVVWFGIHSETRGFTEIPIFKDQADDIILALQEVCY